jgi:hypothetical protein
VENPTTVRCGASRCPAPPLWRFAVAFPFEAATVALRARPQYRCGEHLDLAGLVWLPGLTHGMYVVLDPQGVSPALHDDERSDTVRMESHLIDVDELRPRSVRSDATQLIPVVSGRRPVVPARVTVDVGEPVQVPGQLLVPGTDR